ncbi:MAG: DUF3137 domain-containing protein [Acholeplasma sp.]|nr:DUF3137 domain-containing protein [Acholeplasma sp.]
MKDFNEIEEIRIENKRKYDQGKLGLIISLLFIVITIVIVFSQFASSGNFGAIIPLIFIAFILGVVGIIFSSIMMNDSKNEFESVVKNQFINEILKQNFKDYSYDKNRKISISEINNVGLVRKPDRYTGEDLIQGSYGSTNFQISDVVLEEEHTDDKGNTSYVTYFKGKWIIYQLEKNFNNTLKITERTKPSITKGLRKFETEMHEFNKKFSIYASDQQFFYYVINAYMIDTLLRLEKEHKGRIYYALDNNKFHVAINDNSDFLKLNIKDPVNMETIKTFEEEISFIKRLVDELKLSDVKFRK